MCKGSGLILSVPIKTGKELGMKGPYDKNLAKHIGSELCVGNGSINSKALNGGKCRLGIESHRMFKSEC